MPPAPMLRRDIVFKLCQSIRLVGEGFDALSSWNESGQELEETETDRFSVLHGHLHDPPACDSPACRYDR